MIYQAYQAWSDVAGPVRALAGVTAPVLRFPLFGPFTPRWWSRMAAAYELVARTGLTHRRPAYGIDHVRIDERDVAVREDTADRTPFATLLRFTKAVDVTQPRVLLVAPMSGHFPTLLRGTVRTMLPEHDVHLTDWHNARDVPLAHGRFGLDEFIDHVIRFLEVLGPGAHVVAVCQPSVAVLAAVALMAEAGHPATPRSMTLMAGPVDTRVNPTEVNALATGHSLDWFRRHLIGRVPWRYPGAMRQVYPGFLQLGAFMAMNLGRHVRAHADLYGHLARGDVERAGLARAFYDEYFAVTDLPAEFYLETVQRIFQEHQLPLGRLHWRGRRVDPGAITHTALFTVEGEKDDICAVGQTAAAHDLCTGVPAARRHRHVQRGVGHYGVFNGTRWQREIYPQLRRVIEAANA
jgi:poly(3-hydroxybutyrate) depolymerase